VVLLFYEHISMSDVFLTAAIVIACQMVFLWLLSIPLRNVSIVDIGWGIGFVLVAWLAAPVIGGPPTILYSLVTVWGLRLAWYLWLRNHGKPEDYRYVAMREKQGSSFVWSSLLRVFALQGVIMWIIALPIMAAGAKHVEEPCWILTGIGCALWLIGMFFEVIGDWQLARFKSNAENHGKVMDSGLWKYTRHPNYFGEFVLWWGHWLVCLGVSDYAETWWTVISPLLMSFLLLKVSGVALLERAMKKRSPEYAAYIERTSTFFPRRTKPDSSERGQSSS
jgi:steroid 5-alpha reductase family enzyme